MMVTTKVEEAAEIDNRVAAAQEPAEAPRIERCGAKPGGQLLLKCDEPAVICVDVTGQPAPDVRWHVAGRRVGKSERYRAATSGRRHTLTALRVTDEMEKGVWVLASNSAGEDSCLITVKTYKVLAGLPNTFHDSLQNGRLSFVIHRRMSTQRFTERPLSSETRDLDVTSPTPTDWNKEMEIRNRMRSVDDLMYYGKWKGESLHAHSARRHHDDKINRSYAGGGSMSLNQSYSCESTLSATAATDDEGQPGRTQRRRRTIRLRRRAGSVVSAPTSRHINLDDSIGSAALDVDSMFRFAASYTPVADNGFRSQTAGPAGLPPSGLLSGTAGRTTSVRRTSLRRRRRPNTSVTDVMNASTSDTSSSSFNDVQMTSSTVDLKDATENSSSVERSRPVRRSLRRRRRTSESPSTTSGQDLTVSTTPVTSTTAALTDATDVIKPEALWVLCGEKLKELCRRILDVGVADVADVVTEVTSSGNITESLYREINVVQSTDVVKEPLSCGEAPCSLVSARRHTKGVSYSVDLTAYKLSPISDVIPDLGQPAQPTPKSSDQRDITEDSYNGVENETDGAGSSVTGQHENEDFSRKPMSLTAASDDVYRHDLIADLNQPTSNSSDGRDIAEDSCNGVENEVTGVSSSATDYNDNDDGSRQPTSLTAASDDAYRQDSTETAVNHVPLLEGEHDAEQLQTETDSSEHCHSRLEPEEAIVSDQLSTVNTPFVVGENHAIQDGDVTAQLNGDDASSRPIVDERTGLPGLDISAMLLPSYDLQDILDTIYTLTGGVHGENHATDADGTSSLLSCALPPENPAFSDRTRYQKVEYNYQQLVDDTSDVHSAEQSAAARLERADDDDDEDSLDLDAELYDCDLSPAAADLADTIHLAIAEDDDDLDIADYEYDLEDDDIL